MAPGQGAGVSRQGSSISMVYLSSCARFIIMTRREQTCIAVPTSARWKAPGEGTKRCFSLARPSWPGYNIVSVHAPWRLCRCTCGFKGWEKRWNQATLVDHVGNMTRSVSREVAQEERLHFAG